MIFKFFTWEVLPRHLAAHRISVPVVPSLVEKQPLRRRFTPEVVKIVSPVLLSDLGSEFSAKKRVKTGILASRAGENDSSGKTGPERWQESDCPVTLKRRRILVFRSISPRNCSKEFGGCPRTTGDDFEGVLTLLPPGPEEKFPENRVFYRFLTFFRGGRILSRCMAGHEKNDRL